MTPNEKALVLIIILLLAFIGFITITPTKKPSKTTLIFDVTKLLPGVEYNIPPSYQQITIGFTNLPVKTNLNIKP